ncbi:hypothetical protein AURDEDRAFT_159778 [Auricularia subglabra TFB-10046 SS5]|nr:hypothetical protein AURDEDRAFT_159778 [Auricularia subglabra TFB-10046 SS5]
MSSLVECVKCHCKLDIDEFPVLLRANPDGSKRNKQCYSCLGREKPEKENVNPRAPTAAVDGKHPKQPGCAPTAGQQALPIVDLEAFLAYLREQTGIINVEARVRTADSIPLGADACRSFADNVAKAIWRETDYRFKPQSSHDSKAGTTRVSYTCSQNAKQQDNNIFVVR